MSYYGVFKGFQKLGVQEIGLYEGYFAQKYEAVLGTYPEEQDIYLSHALCSDGPVLELACGTGRIAIELAKKGIEVDGIDYSQSMLDQFQEQLNRCSKKVQNRISIGRADVFSFETEKRYGCIILPATTICLLLDDHEKAVCLFRNMHRFLLPGGRFVFDYRLDQSADRKTAAPIAIHTSQDGDCREFVLLQEFDNYQPGHSVVNFYGERIFPDRTERYIASSCKRIVLERSILELVEQTDFAVLTEETVSLSDGIKIKYLVLEK